MGFLDTLFGSAPEVAVAVANPRSLRVVNSPVEQPMAALPGGVQPGAILIQPTKTTYACSNPTRLLRAWVTDKAFFSERTGGLVVYKGGHIMNVEVKQTGRSSGSVWVTFTNGQVVYVADVLNFAEVGDALTRLMLAE